MHFSPSIYIIIIIRYLNINLLQILFDVPTIIEQSHIHSFFHIIKYSLKGMLVNVVYFFHNDCLQLF
jgi:hypothetical protein